MLSTPSEPAASRHRALALYAAFWALACAISWTTYFIADRTSGGAVVLAARQLIVKFGPSLAGIAILFICGPALRSQFWRALRRFPRILLATAILLPGAATWASLWLAAETGGQSSAALATSFSLAGVAYWLALRIFLGGGLGEEIGLRGVALPLLLGLTGPRLASLLLAIPWTLWHLPALLDASVIEWIAQFALTLSVSILLTFVWVRFGPSLPVAIVFHGALNGWAAYAEKWVPELEALDEWQVARLALLLLLAGVVACLPWRIRNREGENPK